MPWIELTNSRTAADTVLKMMPFDIGKQVSELMEHSQYGSIEPSSQPRVWVNLDRVKTIHFTKLDGDEVGVVMMEKLPLVTKEPGEIAALRRYLEENRIA